MKFNKYILLVTFLCLSMVTNPMSRPFKTFLQTSRNRLAILYGKVHGTFNQFSRISTSRMANLHLARFSHKSRKKILFTAGTAASLAATSLLSYKYPPFIESCKDKFAYLRSLLVQGEDVALQERERINKLLDQHSDDIKIMFYSPRVSKKDCERQTGASYVEGHINVVEFPWLPGYLIKTDPSRVEGARVIEDCIRKNKLRYVGVAQKWLYTPANQEPLVIVKKVERVKNKPISLEQVKDLCCVLRNAKYLGKNYWDFKGDNLYCTPDGRLVFIDTESTSFGCPGIALVYLEFRTNDEKIHEFLEHQLAEIDSKMFVNRILYRRIGLLMNYLQKLGYEKEDAKNEIKKNIKNYVPLLDKEGVAAYEELLDLSFDKNSYKKSNPENLTSEQRILITKLLQEKYISKKQYDEYWNALYTFNTCEKS